MSMIKTLAKVAIGVALAKGASGMINKRTSGASGSGGLFGNMMSSQQSGGNSGGGLEDMLGSVLGGQSNQSSAQSGGLGGLLEQLTGGQQQTSGASGGLNDLLGGLAGGQQGGGGGLGGLLGGLTGRQQGGGGGLGGLLGGLMGGAGSRATAGATQGGFGDLLNQAIARPDETPVQPSQDQEAAAALMLRAMIQAMKSDGEIDNAEKEKLLSRLGDVSHEEQVFVQNEMQAPMDVEGLARSVPRGLEQQVYAMSIMGIDLDSQKEAQYLHSLASALNLGPEVANNIHDQLGVQRIYS